MSYPTTPAKANERFAGVHQLRRQTAYETPGRSHNPILWSPRDPSEARVTQALKKSTTLYLLRLRFFSISAYSCIKRFLRFSGTGNLTP